MSSRAIPPTQESSGRGRLVGVAIGFVLLVALVGAAILLLGRPPDLPPGLTPEPTGSAEPTDAAVGTPTAPVTEEPTLEPTPEPTPEATAPPTPRPATPRPTATPKIAPEIVAFVVPQTADCGPNSTGTVRLSWHVERATGVTISIDGPGVFDSYGPTDAADLPFACDGESHTYLLTTVGGTGPAATSEKVVAPAP
jgi:hypothetical protein